MNIRTILEVVKRRAYQALALLAVYGLALAATRCTPAEQQQAAKDARVILDTACAARAAEKAMTADGGAR